jgi:predicted GIY-YIG superfamily endonuclease
MLTKANKIFDVGVTICLQRRFDLLQKKTKKQQLKLVYYEIFSDSEKATKRENEFIETKAKALIQWLKEINPKLSEIKIQTL